MDGNQADAVLRQCNVDIARHCRVQGMAVAAAFSSGQCVQGRWREHTCGGSSSCGDSAGEFGIEISGPRLTPPRLHNSLLFRAALLMR